MKLKSNLPSPIPRRFSPAPALPALLGLVAFVAQPAAAQMLASRVVGVPDDALCSGGLIYDSGSFQDALGGGGGDPQDQQIVEYVTPTTLPARLTTVCVSVTRTQDLPTNASMDFSIVFYAADGDAIGPAWAGLWPGTPLAVIPAHVDNIPIYPSKQFYAIDTTAAPVLTGGALVGLEWNPSSNGPSPKIMFSIDRFAQNLMPIFNRIDTGDGRWQALTSDLTTSNYFRAVGVRAVQEAAGSVPPARPSATPSFSPPVVLRGTPSTLTFTLANRNAGAATLSADFISHLPAGLAVAAQPNAATNCGHGSVGTAAGATSVSLAAGATLPAAGTCTVSIDVVPASGGSHVVTVASDDLHTDLGNNTALPASATLIVSTGGGNGGKINENFDAVSAPELPAGWTSPVTQGLSIWTTVNLADADTGPNAAYAPNAPRLSDFSLTSPVFKVGPDAVLTFRQKYEFDNSVSPRACFDGGVLEISTDAGRSFNDIVDAGGRFQSGGYTCPIDDDTNPFSGRQAWGGSTGAAPHGGPLDWITVSVDLGAFANQRVVIRWRELTSAYNTWYSASGDWPGWWIDSIAVSNVLDDDTLFEDGFEIDVPPLVAPTITKAFSPSSVLANTPTTLTITLANSNQTAATLTADLVDAFPSGMASAANASTTCSGGPGIDQNETSVTLRAGASIPPTGSCTITVAVAGAASGDLVNTIPTGGLVTDAGSNRTAASATLTVTAPEVVAPVLSKSFSPSTVVRGVPTMLTITLANGNATDATLTATLPDNFPEGMTLSNAASTTCQGGPGLLQDSRMVALQAGATIPASGSCTITAEVIGQAAGDLVNTIPAGGLVTDAGSNGTDASATLTVTAPAIVAPGLSKSFSPSTVAQNAPTTLTITLTNSNAADATLTDTLFDYFPARMMLYETGSTTCQGGPGLLQNGRMVALQAGAIIPASGSCTITVKVVSQVVGDLVNTIPAGGLVTDAGSNSTDASATLTATAP